MSKLQNYSSIKKALLEGAYEVENGISIPPRSFKRKSRYPFGSMKTGQSTLITDRTYGAIIGVLRDLKMPKDGSNPKGFVIRKTPDGIRVWRTK